jgi:hypothetical protein
VEVERLEAVLKASPDDNDARSGLLSHYFLNATLPPMEAIPARRRHILWLIENSPSSELAGVPAATIDVASHRLADPVGFKLASAAWRTQIAKQNISATALANAARFFKLSDPGFTISLLDRAHTLAPDNKEISARLGDQYALAIMGVTMVNKNGYPMQSDAQLSRSPTAWQARKALITSLNPIALAKAGYMLSWQGKLLYHSRRLTFDPAPLADSALQRAVSLAPDDREVGLLMEQHREIQRQTEGEGSARRTSPSAPAVRDTRVLAAPSIRQATAPDWPRVAAGMSREELLKLGEPAGRIAMPEDGRLIEIYQYSSGGKSVGRVRLIDGVVSSIERTGQSPGSVQEVLAPVP